MIYIMKQEGFMKTRSTPASFTFTTVNFGSVFAYLFIHLFIYSKVCTKQVVNMATNTRRNDSGIVLVDKHCL